MVHDMNEVKLHKSFIDYSIMNEFFSEDFKKELDLLQYASGKSGIDGIILAAYLFCPDIIEVNGYIFLKEFWKCDEEKSLEMIKILEEQYSYDKKQIEMSVNSWSLGDFFIGCNSKLLDNEKVIRQFGETLVYFWKQRMVELFPERNIIVELGNELMGEYGLCITIYEEC